MPFFRDQRQYQVKTEPVLIPPVVIVIATLSSQILFSSHLIYQSHTEPTFVPPEIVNADKWIYPWTEPVRVKIDGQHAVALAAPAAIGPVLNPDTQVSQNFESRWHYPWSEPVRFRLFPTSEQQAQIQGPTVIAETIHADKWIYPWSEPVRQKIGLAARLQQSFIAPVLTDDQITGSIESRWHEPWSEPVRFRRFPTSEQQAQVQGPPQTPEFITVDKWIYPWTEPVRQKIGLKTHLQQAFIAPVLDPESQVTQDFESRWHYPWSEPVRFKRLPTSEYPAFTTDARTPEFITADKWAYAWSEPVRFRVFPTTEQQAYAAPVYTPEFITVDKWIYPWTEPVRQKIGLKTHLQQAAIGPVLEPETQISQNYESRWHYAWSEPVRIKPQVPAGEQSFLIQGPVQTPEFITVDKWIYGWSEPVRQKIWLKTYLQQTYIAPVLNPDTQISQDFESRWHFAWSDPVRVKTPLLTAQQQSVAYQSAFFETIEIDKWGFAWSEPVRQKIGIKAHLQQAFIGLTLDPDTQISQGFESRWHFAWSEPVRIKPALRAGLQQTQLQGPVQTPEFITVDKWIYPWTDPVKQKIGIRTALQQAFIAPVLSDEQLTGTIESRWHQPWSEPIRFRKFPAAEQQSYAASILIAEIVTLDKWAYPWTEPVRFRQLSVAEQQSYVAPVTSVFETVTLDKWFVSLTEPVRVKLRLHEALQKFAAPDPVPFVQFFDATSSTIFFKTYLIYQSHIEPEVDPEKAITEFESRWHQPWSEPVRFKLRLWEGLQQTIAFVNPVPTTADLESRWHQPWSEPLHSKPGLGAWLQRPTTPETPVEPFAITRLIQWFAHLNEPVRLKIGFWSYLQREFTTDTYPIPNPFTFWLDATEVNSDSALFGITVYNAVPVISRVPTTVVSIKEIQAIRAADVSLEEEEAIDQASVSIKET